MINSHNFTDATKNIEDIAGFTQRTEVQNRGRISHTSTQSFDIGSLEAQRHEAPTRGPAGGGCDIRGKTKALWVQDTLEHQSRTSGLPATTRRCVTRVT